MANILVRREIKQINYKFDKILNNLDWNVLHRSVDQIYYRFGSREFAEQILRTFPPEVEYDPNVMVGEVRADNIVVNRLLNTHLNIPQPLILNLGYNGQDETLIYDGLQTPFDVMGAINTYYLDRTGGDPEKLGKWKFFEQISKRPDGSYSIQLS